MGHLKHPGLLIHVYMYNFFFKIPDILDMLTLNILMMLKYIRSQAGLSQSELIF